MHCPDCGTELPRRTKFCTRCGAQLTPLETTAIKTTEDRLDEYLEGLFWITVFGLGIIIGGAALLIKVLHFGRGVVIAYLVLSSIAFMINFVLNLSVALRLARSLKKADVESMHAPRDTNKMLPQEGATPGESAHSVTENTTRSLELIPK